MALDHAALLEVLDAMKSAGVDDRIKLAATTIYQALIDAELTAVIGAGPWERTPERTTQRNGSRPRVWSTPAGDLELSIPKLRTGSFFLSLLERRRRVDQALFAVIMEAYLHGVSTRRSTTSSKHLGSTQASPSRKLLLAEVSGQRLVDSLCVVTDADPALPKTESSAPESSAALEEADGALAEN